MNTSKYNYLKRLRENKVISGEGKNISLDLTGPNKNIIKVNVLVNFDLDLTDNSFGYNYGDLYGKHKQNDLDFSDFYYELKSYGLKNSTDKKVENDKEDIKKIIFLGGWDSIDDLEIDIEIASQEYIVNHIDDFK